MASRGPKVIINPKGLREFARKFEAQLRRGQSGPIREMYDGWGIVYLDFVRRRFVKQSSGGGDWEPLSAATISRRRKGKSRAGGSTKILRDTGTLLGALSVGKPGNLFKHEAIGIRVGFDEGQRSSEYGVSIGELAKWHNLGMGVPQRAILVRPDPQTSRRMLGVAQRQVTKLLQQTAIKTTRQRGR